MIDSDNLNIFVTVVQLLNTVLLYPIFKFSFYLIKEINYIKGHLNLK